MNKVSESNGHAVSDWWSEIDDEVLALLEDGRPARPILLGGSAFPKPRRRRCSGAWPVKGRSESVSSSARARDLSSTSALRVCRAAPAVGRACKSA